MNRVEEIASRYSEVFSLHSIKLPPCHFCITVMDNKHFWLDSTDPIIPFSIVVRPKCPLSSGKPFLVIENFHFPFHTKESVLPRVLRSIELASLSFNASLARVFDCDPITCGQDFESQNNFWIHHGYEYDTPTLSSHRKRLTRSTNN